MKNSCPRSLMTVIVGLLLVSGQIVAQEKSPAAKLGTVTRLLMSESFDRDPPPFEGKPIGYASGFTGWRYNAGQLGGKWQVKEGGFYGVENAAVSHPATASYGVNFQNAMIQCEVRLEDVPLDGRRYRVFGLRLTDDHGYVATVRLSLSGKPTMTIEKSDNDGKKGPDQAEPLGTAEVPAKLGQWNQVHLEIVDDELYATVNGLSLRGKHPIFLREKHSVMFTVQSEASIRNVSIWELEPKSSSSVP